MATPNPSVAATPNPSAATATPNPSAADTPNPSAATDTSNTSMDTPDTSATDTTNLSKSQWLETIQTLLISIDGEYIQSCSISVVPEGLKKLNEDAYIPRKVPIGPRFKGSREDLLLMEEVKLRCMLSVLHRAGEKGEAAKYFQKCSDAVWELYEEVRASYVTEIDLKQPELSQIMLVDGCFLLELLISKGLDSELPSRLPGPASQLLKDEDVLSDLMLLENQIPILVLHKLSQTLFPEEFKPDENKPETEEEENNPQVIETEEQRKKREEREEDWKEREQRKREKRAKKINSLALSVLGYSPFGSPSFESPHFLDIVHFFVNRTCAIGGESDPSHAVDMMDTTVKLKLKSCALRLRAAGVSIKVIDYKHNKISCWGWIRDCFGGVLIRLGNIIVKTTEPLYLPARKVKGLDFNFKFRKGKLEIEQLNITKTTKAMWRNIIVWEHHKNNGRSSSTPSGKFTLSALIFDGLICCEADVKFLKKKNIIVDHTNMDHGELKDFFHTLSFGVDPQVLDSTYVQLVDDLNNYSHAFCIFRLFNILWHLFTIRLEWLGKFLNRNYNFVATLVTILTIERTIHPILVHYVFK